MTNGNDKKVTDQEREMFESLDDLHKTSVIAKTLKSKGGNKEAREKRDEYGLDHILREPYYADGRPRYSGNDEFWQARLDDNPLESEKLKAQLLEGNFNDRQLKGLEDSVRNLVANSERVLTREGKYHNYLVNITNSKDINEAADSEHKMLLREYGQVAVLGELERKFKDGNIEKEEEDAIRNIAAVGIGKRRHDEILAAGYSEERAKLVQQLAMIGTGRDYKPEDVVSGVNEEQNRLKKDIKNRFGEDYEVKVAEYVGKALTKLAKSKDPEKENAAIGLLYKAKNGYELGNQRFDDVFKKKE